MKRIYFGVAMILMCSLNTSAEPSTFLNNGVTAHRGDSGAYPENTIPAFESAIALGSDWIELDIFRTKDGELVVIHDVTTEAVAFRAVNVHDTNYYTELKQVDVAAQFRKQNEKSIIECPKGTIPLLIEVLGLIHKQRNTRVSIQPKDDSVEDAIAMVQALKMEAWVGFNDGDLAKMSKVKELAPKIHVFWDRNASFDVDKDVAIALERGFESLVIHVDGVTQETVDKVHAAGLEVGAWTVNDVATMQRLLDLGVDRIYTDEPGRLLEIKKVKEQKDNVNVQK